jgi:hypothetical protein
MGLLSGLQDYSLLIETTYGLGVIRILNIREVNFQDKLNIGIYLVLFINGI